MQGLGSVQHLWFLFFVLGFPIGLSPRTMQGLGSVQHLWFLFFALGFPHRLESEDHASPRFCPALVIFIFCTWFPHRLESEDHARPWFCPWAPVLNWAWAANLLGPKIRGYFRSLRSRGTFWASQCSRCAFSRISKSYGWGWSWKLSQVCFVRSVPWKLARIKCHLLPSGYK